MCTQRLAHPLTDLKPEFERCVNMRSWRPWVAPWDIKKRTKRKKGKYLADEEEPTTTFVAVHKHQSEMQLKYPNPVLVGPVGEAPTIVFPKVIPSKNEESKIHPFRLNTRQGYSYKRHIAGHVQEKNREIRNIKREAKNKKFQYIDHIDRKPDKHVFSKRESLSRNHRQALFDSTRTIRTPQYAKSAFRNKQELQLRQSDRPRLHTLHNSELGEDATISDRKIKKLAETILPLPQSKAARLEFDSTLEQFVIMQAQRDVIRDRSKADYYMKYANGKTSMQLNFRADALYKMICFDRYFTHWQKKHNRYAKFKSMVHRGRHLFLRHYICKWFDEMMRYRLARLKVAKWGYTLYRSPAFRLRIKRKFAARRIQKWFFIDCRVKRLKQKKQQEQYETAILQACTNNVFSKRVTFYAWGRFWYRRHMIKKKIAKDRKIFKTAYFKAFALVLRTEIQKREHLKRLRRFAYGRFLMELRKAYVTRRRRVQTSKTLIIQCAYRVYQAKVEVENMKAWKIKINELFNRVVRRKLGETWQKVQFCFLSWVKLYQRAVKIKDFQKQILLKHRRGDLSQLFQCWTKFVSIVKKDRDDAVRVLQRWCKQIKSYRMAEMLMEVQKFENQSKENVKAQETAIVAAKLAQVKPPSRKRVRLPTSQLYSPYLSKLTDALKDVLECNSKYFDTNVLSADQEYMQRWPLKIPEQKTFLLEKIKESIEAEKNRLRRRRRRSSTMWQTRLKEAEKVAFRAF